MFATAIAEAATTATETSSSFHFELDFSTIISILFVGYFLVMGLACLFTGKVYGFGKSADKYTDESLAKFARPYGLVLIAVGIGLFLCDLYLFIGYKNIPAIVAGAVIVVAGLVGLALGYKKILVKK